MTSRIIDLGGVGIGPSNLSLAALSAPIEGLDARFFEKDDRFLWHSDFLFSESMMQTSFLKDLVTPVDPTSPYSFLSFLVANRRLYQFIHAGFAQVTRAEFSQYMEWVTQRLPNLQFGAPIRAISWKDDFFELQSDDETFRARNISLGTGRIPSVPDCARHRLCETVIHSSQYGKYNPTTKGRRIAVIGGGQSGAELVYHLLLDDAALPESIVWISRRSNFLPLDNTPFVNEWFTPEFSDQFFNSRSPHKLSLLEEQRLASDGISVELLLQIYQRLYHLRFLDGQANHRFRFLPRRELTDLRASNQGWRVAFSSRDNRMAEADVDLVLLATGYEYRFPQYLEPLMNRIEQDASGYLLNEDFSIRWDGPPNRQIYVQNAARSQRGISDPNLSLVAWRSARILNSLLDSNVYSDLASQTMVDWMQ